jgi:hypothetical protein
MACRSAIDRASQSVTGRFGVMLHRPRRVLLSCLELMFMTCASTLARRSSGCGSFVFAGFRTGRAVLLVLSFDVVLQLVSSLASSSRSLPRK